MREKIDQAFETIERAAIDAINEMRRRDMNEAAEERTEHLGALSLLRQLVTEALAAKNPPWTKGDTVWSHEYGLVELGDRTVHGTWLVGDDGTEVSDHELRWPDDQAQRADEHRALSGVLDDLGVPAGGLADRVQLLRERDVGGHSLHRAQEERNKAASAQELAAVVR